MNNGLDTANVWLAILAIASAVQALLLVGGALIALRLQRNVTRALAEFDQRHLAPLSARLANVTDDVHQVFERVKQAEHDVRAKVERLDQAAQSAKHLFVHRAWPLVAGARAVSAAVQALKQPRAHDTNTHMPAREPRAVA